LPFAERAVQHRNHVMPVRLKAGAVNVVYLRVASGGTVSAPVKLWRPAALWKHDQAEYATISLYFGLLIGLFFYNLLLFFSVRDRAYLIYVAFVGCMAIAQAALTVSARNSSGRGCSGGTASRRRRAWPPRRSSACCLRAAFCPARSRCRAWTA
jgi:hypothetical protein